MKKLMFSALACVAFAVSGFASNEVVNEEKVSNEKTEKILTDQDIEILTGKAHKNVGKTDYFRKRGFTDETIETYNLGYTPSYKIKGFDNGPAAIVPYPNENYYFARMINPKGKMTKSFP